MKKLLLLLSLVTASGAFAQPTMTFTQVNTGLGQAVDAVPSIDGTNRLFIVQKTGAIRVIQNGTLKTNPFITVPGVSTDGERGLLSLAFHPQYASNRYFFLYYTNTNGDITVSRGRTSASNPDSAETGVTVLLTIAKPFSNHNGGRLQFGADGFLYFGTGDGGDGGDPNNYAQTGTSLLGKMLRIDVNGFATAAPFYAIPTTNPYTTNPNIADEIIALGLRNPYRWSFDRATGNMWIGDVGQSAREEVDVATPAQFNAGLNYGWRCYEGELAYNTTGCQPQSSYFAPVFTYDRNATTGGQSITGGMVFRNTTSPLNSRYICADYLSANAWLLTAATGGGYTATRQANVPAGIVSFSRSEDSVFYCTTLGGSLYTISAGNVLPVQLTDFTATQRNDRVVLSAMVEQMDAGDIIVVEQVNRNDNQVLATEVIATANRRRTFEWNFPAPKQTTGYRVRLESKTTGRLQFSKIIELTPSNGKQPEAWVAGRQLVIRNVSGAFSWNLVNSSGLRVAQQQKTNATVFTLESHLSAGVYYLQIATENGEQYRRSVKID